MSHRWCLPMATRLSPRPLLPCPTAINPSPCDTAPFPGAPCLVADRLPPPPRAGAPPGACGRCRGNARSASGSGFCLSPGGVGVRPNPLTPSREEGTPDGEGIKIDPKQNFKIFQKTMRPKWDRGVAPGGCPQQQPAPDGRVHLVREPERGQGRACQPMPTPPPSWAQVLDCHR